MTTATTQSHPSAPVPSVFVIGFDSVGSLVREIVIEEEDARTGPGEDSPNCRATVQQPEHRAGREVGQHSGEVLQEVERVTEHHGL